MAVLEMPQGETRPYVEGVIRYTDRSSDGMKLMSVDHDRSTFKLHEHVMPIYDARAPGRPLTFDRNGFTLIRHDCDIDFLNKADVERRYYPEAKRLIRELTGAGEVLVFLDLIRSEVREDGAEPAHNAHVDFNRGSILRWIKALSPDRAGQLSKKRILNINLWRPVKPVERMPLAVCDASTVDRADLLNITIEGRAKDAEGDYSGYNLAYNPNHRWYYYPRQQPGEVLAFRLYDSEEDRPHLTAHTAFEDPTSPPDAPKRVSHEIRTIAFM